MEPVKLGRFVLASRTLTLVLVLVLVTISSTNSAKTRSEKQINSLWWNNSIAKGKVLIKKISFSSCKIIGIL